MDRRSKVLLMNIYCPDSRSYRGSNETCQMSPQHWNYFYGLVQNGSTKHRSKDGMTPYHIICQSSGHHAELLDLTINLCGPALVNTRSENGSTALLCAVQNANLNCVKCLIANGANVYVEDKFVKTLNPIVETIERLNCKISKILTLG